MSGQVKIRTDLGLRICYKEQNRGGRGYISVVGVRQRITSRSTVVLLVGRVVKSLLCKSRGRVTRSKPVYRSDLGWCIVSLTRRD